MGGWLEVPKDLIASFGEMARFSARVVGEVLDGSVLRFAGEALRQAGILILGSAVVIAFLGIFAFNYVFTQTLLATHPEISVIK